MELMVKPKIKVFTLGGTIAMVSDGSERGVSPKLKAESLINAVPGISDIADIDPVTFRQLPSPSISYHDIFDLLSEIYRSLDNGTNGIVITQGTDTLEETSFLLDRIYTGQAPIVTTGAMRNPTLPGADGPSNILHAVMVAASSEACGLGVLTVFNGDIHAARFVQKGHTQSPAAFTSSPIGPIGWVSESKVRIISNLNKRYIIDLNNKIQLPKVALLKVSMGDDGSLIDTVIDKGFDGLVIEGTGGGHLPAAMVEKITKAVAKIPVVLASRIGSGELLRETYMFPGSEIDLMDKGIINSGLMNGLQAKIILTLLLANGVNTNTIISEFNAWLE
tara:strand:- start:55274 stop:56275 length:1002 start_codon:yes stop_codon:yes gene_type:complete